MITLMGKEIKPTRFPDGTTQVWKLDEELFKTKELTIDWRFEREDEFFVVAQLRMLLQLHKLHLHVPYFPFARQDKVVSNETTFG